MRILIAEDDPIARNLLRVTLESWNYDVLVTNSGSEAWEAIQNLENGNSRLDDARHGRCKYLQKHTGLGEAVIPVCPASHHPGG